MNRFLIPAIRAYRAFISPMLGRCCRFYPSCSEYCEQAFEKKNFFKAVALSVLRIARCNPLSSGGFDPVE